MLVIGAPELDDLRELVHLAEGALDVDGQSVAEAMMRDACLVARDSQSDVCLGFIIVEREPYCDSHLLALAVDRDHRSEGIGSALVKAAQDIMMRTGARHMHLEVRSDNRRAQEFYARHGFAPEGLQTQAYPDGADAVVLARPL